MENIHLAGLNVVHKKYKEGKIIKVEDGYIWVAFASGEKKLQFPGVFQSALRCTEQEIQQQLMVLAEETQEKEQTEKQLKIQAALENFQKSRENVPAKSERKPRTRTDRKDEKENVAFKCNFCDGGQNKHRIGFYAACSDKMIRYNIEVAKHRWCCDKTCDCFQYYKGRISRKTLDQICAEVGSVCYESQMLRDWTASAGYALKGDNRERPTKMNCVQKNRLAVLTSREPYEEEKDRFIFGVFLIDETFHGDDHDAGIVEAHTRYRISLSRTEAHKMLYWNYYRNEGNPSNIQWSTGLYRYLNDHQAANILKDIAEMKKGTPDERLAVEIFNYYCSVNGMDPEGIDVPQGALVLKKAGNK